MTSATYVTIEYTLSEKTATNDVQCMGNVTQLPGESAENYGFRFREAVYQKIQESSQRIRMRFLDAAASISLFQSRGYKVTAVIPCDDE